MEGKKERLGRRIGRFFLRRALSLGVVIGGAMLGWLIRGWTSPQPWTRAAAEAMRRHSGPPALDSGRSAGEAEVIGALKEKDRPFAGLAALESALDAGEIHDFPAVIRLLEESPFPQQREFLKRLYAAWGARDPVAAIAFLSERPGNTQTCGEIAMAWMNRDFAGAVAAMKAQPAVYSRAIGRDWETLWALQSMAKDGVRRLLAVMDVLPEKVAHQGAAHVVMTGDPRQSGSVADWLNIQDKATTPVLKATAAQAAALAWLSEHPGKSVDEAVGEIGSRLSAAEADKLATDLRFHFRRSPDDLAKQISATATADLQRREGHDAVSRLIDMNSKTALALTRERPDLPLTGEQASKLMLAAWRDGPGTAAALLKQQTDPEKRHAMEVAVAGRLRRPLATEWQNLATLGPEGDGIRAALLAKADSQQVNALLSQIPPADRQRWRAVQLDRLSALQPAAAAEYFTSASDATQNDMRAAVQAEKIAEQWVRQDATAAARWVQSLPAGPARERATVALIEAGAQYSPEAAAQWAATLTDPAARAAASRALSKPSAPSR